MSNYQIPFFAIGLLASFVAYAADENSMPAGLFAGMPEAADFVLPPSSLPPEITASSSAGDPSSARYDPTMFVYDVGSLAGESIDPRTLQLSWEQTDLVLAGNSGLDIVVSRSHNKTAFVYQQMGDWVLGIPRIQIPTAPIYLASDPYYYERPWLAYWQEMIGDTGAAGLCDGAPYLIPENSGQGPAYAAPWVLDVPGEGQKVLMQRDAEATQGLYPDTAFLVTADNWYAECIHPSESSVSWGGIAWGGFRVVSPEGTRYSFDVIYGVMPGEMGQGAFGGWIELTPSKTEDVHGNLLDYEYFNSLYNQYGYPASQLLYRIVGYTPGGEVDGRAVQFTYDPYFSYDPYNFRNFYGWKHSLARAWVADPENPGSPKSNDPRQVIYTAQPDVFGSLLEKVVLPEGLTWQYSSDVNGSRVILPNGTDHSPLVALARVTLPTGGIIDYNYHVGDSTAEVWRPTRLSARTVSGPDVPTAIWRYAYSLANHLEFTSITDPFGKVDSYEFYEGRETYVTELLKGLYGDWDYGYPLDNGAYMGRLRKHQVLSPDFGALRATEINWGSRPGIGLLAYGHQNHSAYNFGTVGYYNTSPAVPLRTTVSNLETGVIFSTNTELADYDQYGHPLFVTEEGFDGATGVPVSRSFEFEYFNQLSPWVNGLMSRESIDGAGSITRSYFSSGLLKTLNEYGIQEHYEYYANGELWKRKWTRSGAAYEHRYEGYKRGIAQHEYLPESIEIHRSVLDSGQIGSETDALGNTINYQYDGLGRLLSVEFPGNTVAPLAINYSNEIPQHIELAHADYKKQLWLDSFGRIVRTVKKDLQAPASEIAVLTSYDAIGRPSWVSDPIFDEAAADSTGIRYTYDFLSRPLSHENAATGELTQFCYSVVCGAASDYSPPLLNGYLEIDPRGYTTARLYRSFGKPDASDLMKVSVQETLASDTGFAKFIDTSYERNSLSLVVAMIQDDLRRTYVYDARNLLVEETFPEAAPLLHEYDEVGNRTKTTQAYRSTVYRFDGLNRRTSVTYSDRTPGVQYGYLENGLLGSVATDLSRWDYAYSPTGKLLSETLQVDGISYLVAHEYDASDALAATLYPSGARISYNPDAFSRASTAAPYITDASYHADGGIAEIKYANGVTTTFTQLRPGLPDGIRTNRYAEVLLNQQYSYDPAENISAINWSGLYSSAATNLSYDGLNRLIKATGSWGNTGEIRYDESDNIVFSAVGADTRYDYDEITNHLVSVDGNAYQYDDFGNVTHNGKHDFHYFATNQISMLPSLPGDTYVYDGLNKKVLATQGGDKLITGYGRSGSLLFKINATLGEATEYYYLGKYLVASESRTVTPTGSADTDGDLIPDHIEIRNLTDPDTYDSNADFDGDGLTNFTEFLYGSYADSSDTDADGMPDKFEHDFGLSPVDFRDAAWDLDSDGLSNQDEYARGTNPIDVDTDADGRIDSEDPDPLMNPVIVVTPVMQLILGGS